MPAARTAESSSHDLVGVRWWGVACKRIPPFVGVGSRPWLVDDDLWMLIEPLLPSWPRKAPGPKPVDDRLCLQGILCVLHNDISWQLLPLELGFGSRQTCWRRLGRWHKAGVFEKLHHILLAELHAADAAGRAPGAPCGPHPRSLSGFGMRRAQLGGQRDGQELAARQSEDSCAEDLGCRGSGLRRWRSGRGVGWPCRSAARRRHVSWCWCGSGLSPPVVVVLPG
ncbi:transposase [Streptomyces sp. NPDC001093]|uniref:transposase n=1 Tax=Streptomyces sp. NPDC001093 TaxID=3154376 RepID=UPI003324EF8A